MDKPQTLCDALRHGLAAIHGLKVAKTPDSLSRQYIDWLNGAREYLDSAKAEREIAGIDAKNPNREPFTRYGQTGRSGSSIANKLIASAWATIKFHAGCHNFTSADFRKPLGAKVVFGPLGPITLKGQLAGTLADELPAFDLDKMREWVEAETIDIPCGYKTKGIGRPTDDDVAKRTADIAKLKLKNWKRGDIVDELRSTYPQITPNMVSKVKV